MQADDERSTNPGDALRTLLERYGPCLVLIDEWVSYARQLHDGSDLPAGSFETQFTFAQALTEAVKVTENCLLVVSLPASDATSVAPGAGAAAAGSPHPPPPRRTTPKWAAFAGAKPSTACATWWRGSNRPGAPRAPRRASRSCGGGCSSP